MNSSINSGVTGPIAAFNNADVISWAVCTDHHAYIVIIIGILSGAVKITALIICFHAKSERTPIIILSNQTILSYRFSNLLQCCVKGNLVLPFSRKAVNTDECFR